jgi:hypothetical protein
VEIRGSNQNQRFDPAHLSIVQREIARSVKPNLLRELEDKELADAELERLLNEDLVDLSPEAKELLISMQRERRKKKSKKEQEQESDFLSLLANLDDMRKEVEESNLHEPMLQSKGKPFFPPTIMLSSHVPRSPSSQPGRRSPDELGPAGELIRKMVAISPRPELRDQVARELQVFGRDVIAPMKQFGIRIIVLGRHEALTDVKIGGMHVVAPSERTFDGRLWSGVRGLYDNSRRLLAVGEELIGLAHRSTAVHEFAHAYDHFISERGQRRLPLSVQLWNSFRQERGSLVSDYAGTNPAEYFAESVEAFFAPGGRELLRSKDPLMCDHLASLFAS